MKAHREEKQPGQERSDFLASLRTGLLVGFLGLAVALPWIWSKRQPQPPATPPVAQAPAPAPQAVPQPQPQAAPPLVFADFRGHEPSPEARVMANWVVQSRDHQDLSFVIVDKKDARVYVFDAKGRMKDTTPALLGSAHGDHTVPGIGEKPLSQVLPEEKTTPAGRFIAELGMNTNNEDIVWVDYDAAVSMHRVRANNKAERRLERLASPTPEDNRISFGCINLPPSFYEDVLRATVRAGKTVIYVMPETRTFQETFASFKNPVLPDARAATQAARAPSA